MSDDITTNRTQPEAQANALRSSLTEKLENLEALPPPPAEVAKASIATPAQSILDAVKAPAEDVPREVLETKADVQRWRLARSLESLSRRWHDAWSLKLQLSRHPLPAVLLGAGTLLTIGTGIGALAYRAQLQKRQRPMARLRAFVRSCC